jgi:hypothetical protein
LVCKAQLAVMMLFHWPVLTKSLATSLPFPQEPGVLGLPDKSGLRFMCSVRPFSLAACVCRLLVASLMWVASKCLHEGLLALLAPLVLIAQCPARLVFREVLASRELEFKELLGQLVLGLKVRRALLVLLGRREVNRRLAPLAQLALKAHKVLLFRELRELLAQLGSVAHRASKGVWGRRAPRLPLLKRAKAIGSWRVLRHPRCCSLTSLRLT